MKIEGAVFTMYDARTNLSLQVVENVKSYLNQNIYKTIIPRNVRLAEAPSHGLPINLYDPKSVGAESYQMLAEEVIAKRRKRGMTTKKKTGLGRGLNTLIPSAPVKDTESEKILKKEEQIKSEIMVPILKVEPNPNQPRRQFDDDSLQELADSVKQYGILQPLIVKKHDKLL